MRAWPAVASARCSCAFAAATPVALGEELRDHAGVPQATPEALGRAVSSPNATEAVPRSGITHSGSSEADPESHAHGDVASTVNRMLAAA